MRRLPRPLFDPRCIGARTVLPPSCVSSVCSWRTTPRWRRRARQLCSEAAPTCRRYASASAQRSTARLSSSLGEDADRRVLRALDLAWSGAMLWAGMGHIAFTEVPDALIGVASDSWTLWTDHESMALDSTTRAARVQPLRLPGPRGPVSHLCTDSCRGPSLPERRARLLGAFAPRGRPRSFSEPGTAFQPLRCLARPGGVRARSAQGHVVPGHGPTPPHPDAFARIEGLHTSHVAELEQSVRSIALEHVERALDRGSFDFVLDFAGRLPMDVISDMIGVSPSDRTELRRLADLLVHREEGVFDIPPQGIEAAMALAGYFGEMVSCRRASLTDDLTSALVDADLDGDRLTDDEVVSFLFLMTVAGNETTTKLLANAWYWAWRFPDQRNKVLTDPARVPDWVEETLRFDTSTQMLLRVTTGEVTFYDVGTSRRCEGVALLGFGQPGRKGIR